VFTEAKFRAEGLACLQRLGKEGVPRGKGSAQEPDFRGSNPSRDAELLT